MLGGEQAGLGVEVALHGLVEVEVVALEVGEAGDVDREAVQAVQDDGMAQGYRLYMAHPIGTVDASFQPYRY